jgi:transcription elongation factor Elf1
MNHFYRTFECNECHAKASAEEMTKHSAIVSCEPCEVSELWTEEEPDDLEYFTLLPIAAQA